MTTTLHDLLDAGQPDLPPAPRRPGGRHRADRGSMTLSAAAVIGWAAFVVVLVVLFATGQLDGTDRPPVDCSVACGETMPYPQPVPGAPPQAPHAGFPGYDGFPGYTGAGR